MSTKRVYRGRYADLLYRLDAERRLKRVRRRIEEISARINARRTQSATPK